MLTLLHLTHSRFGYTHPLQSCNCAAYGALQSETACYHFSFESSYCSPSLLNSC